MRLFSTLAKSSMIYKKLLSSTIQVGDRMTLRGSKQKMSYR